VVVHDEWRIACRRWNLYLLWSLKTYDGREKSLLRGATRDVLPESVTKRVKTGYPWMQDPQYGAAPQMQAKDLLAAGDDTLFGLIDRAALEQIVNLDPTTLQPLDRARVERVLNLSVWLEMYHPEIIF
jgi:asparagine synthase (glutamine-hydrolysing)